jgi:WD40 repeat protein
VQFSPDGNLLATSSVTDGTVQLWQLKGAVLLDHYIQERVAFSHSGKLIAVADGGGAIRLLDSRTHQLVRRLIPDPHEPGVGSTTRDVAFSADDRLLATAGRNAAWVWSTETGSVVARVPVPKVDVLYVVAFSPGGHTLAMAGIPGPIMLYDVDTGRIVRKLGGSAEFGGYERLAFTPSGRDLIAAGVDVEVWDVQTGKLAAKFSNSAQLYSAAVSPDRADGRRRLR